MKHDNPETGFSPFFGERMRGGAPRSSRRASWLEAASSGGRCRRFAPESEGGVLCGACGPEVRDPYSWDELTTADADLEADKGGATKFRQRFGGHGFRGAGASRA